MYRLSKIATLSLMPVGLAFAVLMAIDNLGMFCFFVLPSLLISVAAAYFTHLLCRIWRPRDWRQRWTLGLSGPFAAGIAAFLIIWLVDSWLPGSDGKGNLPAYYLCFCSSGFVFALLPSQLIVRRFREKTEAECRA